MDVKEIMSRNIVSLSSNDSVQRLISLMEKHHIHEIPIIDNKKLVGMIQSRRLTQKTIQDPYKTKVKSIKMSAPAVLDQDQDLDSAAKLILKTGLRALPVIENKKVIGLVSLHDIVNEVSRSKLFRQTKAQQLMSETITITDDTDIGKARVLMREKNISRIPVTDRTGKLKGIVTAFDMLKSIKPRQRMNWYSMAAEMERIMQIPISTIMNKKPVTADSKSSLTDIAVLMNKFNTSGVIIAPRGYPQGIIVLKDLLEFYVSGLKREGVYYQVIGLGDEDSFITDTVDRMINETIRKVSSVYDILSLFIHVKKYHIGPRGKTKYSIRIRLRTPKKMYITKAWAWDLRKSVDDALDQLERSIFKAKKINKDRFKRNVRRIKEVVRRR